MLRKHFPQSDLPKDGRTLLATPTFTDVQKTAGGMMHYFGVENCIKSRLTSNPTLLAHSCLHLQMNIDGMPLFKSTNEQFWPMLGLIEEEEVKSPFLIGLFVGYSKPTDANVYLSDFVKEMSRLANDGILFKDRFLSVAISAFVCDAPARAFVKNVKSHNAYHGCERCVQEGVWTNSRMTFPEVDAAPRTDYSFKTQQDMDHHKDGQSALLRLNIGMVSQFVLDFMHLVCLGVMRKLLWFWMRGPLPTRIGIQAVHRVSQKICSLGKFLPVEFGRKGRSLSEVDRWKATEFHTFLLYTGPISLKNTLPDGMFHHFLLLHVAITILCSPSLSSTQCDCAQELLVVFVRNFTALYGDFVVYNIHGLVHLADDVRKFGPLPNFSAFPFENYLQKMKRKVRKPSKCLQQIVRRLAEEESVSKANKNKAGPEGEHFEVLSITFHSAFATHSQIKQFSRYATKKFTLSLDNVNNAVLVGHTTYKIENIVLIDGCTYFVSKQFKYKSAFFTNPVDSLMLDIAFVRELCDDIILLSERNVQNKVVLLPYKDGFVTYPLNHLQ